jgi:hypothetical protein
MQSLSTAAPTPLQLNWRKPMRVLVITAIAGTMLLGGLAPSFAKDGDGTFHADMYRFQREDQARLHDYRAAQNLAAGQRSVDSFAQLRAQTLRHGG